MEKNKMNKTKSNRIARRFWLCLDLMFSEMNQSEIAKKYGVSLQAVIKCRKSLGLTHEARVVFAKFVKPAQQTHKF